MSGPSVNERVDYVSPFRTGTYAAIIRKVNADGTVGIDVYLPGLRGRFDTEPAVHLRSVVYGSEGRARPRRGLGEEEGERSLFE